MINRLKNADLNHTFKKVSLFFLGFFWGFCAFLFVCEFYFINLSSFFWGGGGHSLFVGGGVIASLFH